MDESGARRALLEATRETLERYEASQVAAQKTDRPPAPGDVYVLEQTKDYSLSWVVVAGDPAESGRLLAVPADGNLLVGSADVAVPEDSPMGLLNLRCRFAGWIDADKLDPHLRLGVLERGDVERARRKWLEMADGALTGTVLEQEVDEDPEYQEWVTTVLVPARRALFGPVPDAKPVKRKPRSPAGLSLVRWSYPLAAAAAVLLALGAGWWWWNEKPPGYRNDPGSTIEPRLGDRIALQRENAVLRWRGPEGSTYDVLVMTEQMLVVAEASNLQEPQFRIPGQDLANLPTGTRLLWRVEAVLPNGRRLASPTFEVRLR